jgi:hypothetical protein
MSPSPEALQRRYSSIEQVYAEQNWSEVDRQSQQLLAELPDDPRDPLRQRLVLLLAHTRLYGSGEAEAAAQLYAAVAQADPEPALLDIAKQGLAQCAALCLPAPETLAPETPAAETPEPRSAAAAMPWLQELGNGGRVPAEVQELAPFQRAETLPVEVVEEPEQIEVALADPQRQELVTLELGDAAQAEAPEQPPSESAAPGQESAKPLRWPFVAGSIKKHLEEQNPPETEFLEPVGASASAEDRLALAASVLAPETPPEPAPVAVSYSPEELQELSRGLLRVELS